MMYQHDWNWIRAGLRAQGKSQSEIVTTIRRWKRAVALAGRLGEEGEEGAIHEDAPEAVALLAGIR